MTDQLQVTALTLSAAMKFGLHFADLTQLAQVFENSKLEVQITFCAQDGSVLETSWRVSEPLVARTGERYGS